MVLIVVRMIDVIAIIKLLHFKCGSLWINDMLFYCYPIKGIMRMDTSQPLCLLAANLTLDRD